VVLLAFASCDAGSKRTLLARVKTVNVVAPFDPAVLAAGRAEYTTNYTSRDSGPAKVHVRGERRYAGPMPSPAELQHLVASGMADAFYPLLTLAARQSLTKALLPLDSELGTLAVDQDQEIAKARLAVRGTVDEIVISRALPGFDLRNREAARRASSANRSREIYYHTSLSGEERYFRVTRERCPRVFEIQQAIEETSRLRAQVLQEQMRDLLTREGVAALDPARLLEASR